MEMGETGRLTNRLVLSCLLTLYTAVMSFGSLFPFGLWVFEPDWLLNHSQLVCMRTPAGCVYLLVAWAFAEI